jgi:hypothetical protein
MSSRITDNTRSTTLHTLLHELVRLSTLPLIVPSPTSGFHSSYYLGLGWGVAETAWGIVQGWDQLALYEDVMRPSDDEERRETSSKGERGERGERRLLLEDPADDGVPEEVDAEGAEGGAEEVELDEAELERKVEILENMRARRGARGLHRADHTETTLTTPDLEEVIGVPFPVCATQVAQVVALLI